MYGYGMIGLANIILDTGMLQMEGDNVEINIDTPAGQVTAFFLTRRFFQK